MIYFSRLLNDRYKVPFVGRKQNSKRYPDGVKVIFDAQFNATNKRKEVFATNSDFLIPFSLQSEFVDI